MFKKLTFARRALLIIGLFSIFSNTFKNNYGAQDLVFGTFLLVLVLLLELKDKLLAKNELSEGQSVQRALMPQEKPEIAGWDIWFYSKPANEVGGDLVDYIKINEDRFGFVLADISGKGLAAALLMAKLQSIIRALAPDYISIKDFVSKLNSVFLRDSIKRSFASLIYLEIEPDKETVKYVNAGHFPPIILSENKIKELPKGSMAIGLSEKATFKEKKLTIKQDETLFLYSDGLVEAMNESGEFFEERFFDVLPKLKIMSAESTGKWLVNAVENFIGKAKVHDDLSLLILKKK